MLKSIRKFQIVKNSRGNPTIILETSSDNRSDDKIPVTSIIYPNINYVSKKYILDKYDKCSISQKNFLKGLKDNCRNYEDLENLRLLYKQYFGELKFKTHVKPSYTNMFLNFDTIKKMLKEANEQKLTEIDDNSVKAFLGKFFYKLKNERYTKNEKIRDLS